LSFKATGPQRIRERQQTAFARQEHGDLKYTLLAGNVFCDYDPIKKKADIGSKFVERE
jgi:hypothetical protein